MCHIRIASEGVTWLQKNFSTPISSEDILTEIEWLYEQHGKVVIDWIDDESIHLTSLDTVQADQTEEKLNEIKEMIRHKILSTSTPSKNSPTPNTLTEIIQSLTKKEQEALKAAVSVLYFEDSSDYANGLWEVVRAIIGNELVDDENFHINKVRDILCPN